MDHEHGEHGRKPRAVSPLEGLQEGALPGLAIGDPVRIVRTNLLAERRNRPLLRGGEAPDPILQPVLQRTRPFGTLSLQGQPIVIFVEVRILLGEASGSATTCSSSRLRSRARVGGRERG